MSTREQCKCKYCSKTSQKEIANRYTTNMYIPSTSGGAAARAESSPRRVAAHLAGNSDVLVPFKDYRQGNPTNPGT